MKRVARYLRMHIGAGHGAQRRLAGVMGGIHGGMAHVQGARVVPAVETNTAAGHAHIDGAHLHHEAVVTTDIAQVLRVGRRVGGGLEAGFGGG
jgi:hypothetical protein